MAVAKKTFIERVVSFLKNDDDAKIRKFQKRAIQKLKETIRAKESTIETLEYKLQDALEAQEEAVVNIDVTQLENVDAMDNYIAIYINNQKEASEKIEVIEYKIQEARESIERANAYIKKLS